jgi:carboxyl-terminal processing protease
MSRLSKATLVCLSVVVLSYVALGYVLAQTANERTYGSYRSLAVYSEVMQHIHQDYVEEPNLQLVTAGALHGLLESLDPLSSYLSPLEYADYKRKSQNGAKGQVGVALSKRFGYVAVISVLPESPAQKAGLRGGDILEGIAGFTTREMAIGQAQLLLAGDPGTRVKVSVVRRGRTEPQEIEIIRAEIPPTRIVTDRIPDAGSEIGYLRVPAFEAGKANQLRERLQQLDRQGVRKLILDLRECALGDLAEGIAAARLFLAEGTVTILRGQKVPTQEKLADAAKVAWKHPLTVLISNGTSGAAEILAAAIGDNKRGAVVGERTFGTASEQELIPLEDGAALILTVANYHTPSGKSIPANGVLPTVEAGDDETPESASDLDESPEAPDRPAPASRDLREDPVVLKAIELLRDSAARPAA